MLESSPVLAVIAQKLTRKTWRTSHALRDDQLAKWNNGDSVVVLSVWYNRNMLQAAIVQYSTAHSCGCSDLLRRAEPEATDQLQWDERQDEANRISWLAI